MGRSKPLEREVQEFLDDLIANDALAARHSPRDQISGALCCGRSAAVERTDEEVGIEEVGIEEEPIFHSTARATARAKNGGRPARGPGVASGRRTLWACPLNRAAWERHTGTGASISIPF